jgi:sarcosine oxidase delta subunit
MNDDEAAQDSARFTEPTDGNRQKGPETASKTQWAGRYLALRWNRCENSRERLFHASGCAGACGTFPRRTMNINQAVLKPAQKMRWLPIGIFLIASSDLLI